MRRTLSSPVTPGMALTTRSHPAPAQGLYHHVQSLAIKDGCVANTAEGHEDKPEETSAALQTNQTDLRAPLEPTRRSSDLGIPITRLQGPHRHRELPAHLYY